MNGDITFNSHDLQSYNPTTDVGIATNSIDHTNNPDTVAPVIALADANESALPTINYPSKQITITGVIKGSSQDDLDTRIDTFKGYFNAKKANLDIDYAGTTRRYTATANAVSVTRQQKALFATFTVEFVCTKPFGFEISATTIGSETNYTSSSLTIEKTIAGSAPYQLPIITITIDALTGDGDYVQVTNDLNGQAMVISGIGFEDGDVLVIDAENRTVKVNDVDVDYYGTFLELEPGDNSITYTDGFTTRTVDVLMEYHKRYK